MSAGGDADLQAVRPELEGVWAACAPGDPSPLAPGEDGLCRVCRPWRDVGDAFPRLRRLRIADELAERSRRHWAVVHTPFEYVPRGAWPAYLRPRPDTSDGRTVYWEPDAGVGVADRSKAFFLLNRHRLGPIRSATMGDARSRFREGASLHLLRLYDPAGGVLALAGCAAGAQDRGPQGTLFVLRLAGFPEGGPPPRDGPRAWTPLERIVLQEPTFVLRTDGRGLERL